jgi:hypothetical protein
MNGEQKSSILYAGEYICLAHDHAAKPNAEEFRYWEGQQKAEQAAERACARFHEEGHGWARMSLKTKRTV